MDIRAKTRDRRFITMTVLGLVSGILSSQLYELGPWWQELSVGIVFGVVIGAALVNLKQAVPTRAAAFALLAVAAWWLAERTTIQIFDLLEEDKFFSPAGVAGGIAGGLVGAAGLALAAALLFPWFRRRELWLLAIGAGGLLGLLLVMVGRFDSTLVLFVPWQAALAACLALGFPPEVSDDP